MGTANALSGSVVVSVNVDRPTDEAWRALTERERLRMWFGNTSGSLTTAGTWRVDFGDGDFFVAESGTADLGRLVEFDWRFLGVGPVSHIRWEVQPAPGGSQVTVRDRSEDRDQGTVRELTEGWKDFFSRLVRYLETGQNTRYDCRAEIDGAIHLPATEHALLGESGLSEWLPVVTDEQDRRWFLIADSAGSAVPERFEIGYWQDTRTDLRFVVRIPGAAALTSASLWVRPIPRGVRLFFSHAGWNELGLAQERTHDLRTRFAAAWVSALDKADQVTRAAETGTR